MSKRTPIRIWDWDSYGTKRIRIRKNGVVNRNAKLAFASGQCHAFALAMHSLTNWPIYGIVGKDDTENSPAHIVVKNPKNGGYLDIKGYGAVTKWRKTHGKVKVISLKPEQIYKFDGYLLPDIKAAMPFAKRLLENLFRKVN